MSAPAGGCAVAGTVWEGIATKDKGKMVKDEGKVVAAEDEGSGECDTVSDGI